MDTRVINRPDIPRRHDKAFMRELTERSLQPGASVAAIAQEHGINANLLFNWRRLHRRLPNGDSSTASKPILLPVVVAPNETAVRPQSPAVTAASHRLPAGLIEVDIGAARIRLRGVCDQAVVRAVLATLLIAAK